MMLFIQTALEIKSGRVENTVHLIGSCQGRDWGSPRERSKGQLGMSPWGAEELGEQNQKMKSRAQRMLQREVLRQKKEGGFWRAACRMAPKTRSGGRVGEGRRGRLRQVPSLLLQDVWSQMEEKTYLKTRDLPWGQDCYGSSGPSGPSLCSLPPWHQQKVQKRNS